MSDSVSPTTLERSVPVMATAHPLEIEQGLGIAKLRFFYLANGNAAFRNLVGVEAPAAGGQIEAEGLVFSWLAPGEWLITGKESDVSDWLREAGARGGDETLALAISHARTSFLLRGGNARVMLAAHCPLDLGPAAFPIGAVARTLLGDTSIFIARLADQHDSPRFRIIVEQTMATYVARLLAV